MNKSEDIEKGLFAIDIDDSGENILQFGRMKYNGKLECYVSDCILSLQDFVSYPTKQKAKIAAKHLGFTQDKVQRIGSRFWLCWGIRHDFHDNYFLATFK